ncbi:MAG: ATP-dependent RecD-like DNA helicase [Syntrophobacteraceae bacterium]|nr:ATP-dependent RecD-like DNA helicase [Syntrophobacteraceae bacterium]
MLAELQGQIERITFTNEENGFTIAKVKVSGRQDLVCVVGNLMAPMAGEIIKMQGEWTNHPKFGEQFKIVFYKSMVPATVSAIQKYLGSGLIKGIGPVMAKRIVKKFGKDTLDVIEGDLDRLCSVEGIGAKRLLMIKKAWADQKEIREVMIFLQSHGVSSGYATKIFKHYGNEAIQVVKENPYRLATDIFGIGFVTADKIAEKLGFAKDCELRAQAGILYVLSELSDEGHVYYPYEPLIEKCNEILQIDREGISRAIGTIALNEMIVIEELGEGVENNKAVYLAQFHVCETSIARRLGILSKGQKSVREIDADKALRWAQEKLSITLARKQAEAVKTACRSKVMVLTGQPGTGKTTIINSILKIFHALGVNVLLAAPTGRAAKRMSEATGCESKTIHRLLEFSPKKAGFQKNEQHPLGCDLLIVDEFSMVDCVLMHHLLKAIPQHATFIMVGDVNQLPSVGAGNVLNDVISSGKVPVVELNEIFRQARQSSIIVNAHKINSGVIPSFKPSEGELDDFFFIRKEEPEEILELILELVKNRIPNRFGFDPIDDIQVLTPMHKGTIGAGNLNAQLQEMLNPSEHSVSRWGRNFRVRDKVMQIKNNYDKEVFNGDIGRITGIDEEAQELSISFDGRQVDYDFTDLDEVVLAYAVSVHKAQGSQYPVVVIPLHTQHYMLLQRNLIYTGITRGQKLVIMVGTPKALSIAVKNNRTRKRYTRLAERIDRIL